MTRLHQVARPADDLDRAVAFYGGVLRLPLTARFDPPGLAFFDLDGVRLLVSVQPEVRPGDAGTLYLWVDDIEAAHADLLARGVTFEQEPARVHRDDDGTFGPAGEEEWMAFFRDPGGGLLAIATRRRPPPG